MRALVYFFHWNREKRCVCISISRWDSLLQFFKGMQEIAQRKYRHLWSELTSQQFQAISSHLCRYNLPLLLTTARNPPQNHPNSLACFHNPSDMRTLHERNPRHSPHHRRKPSNCPLRGLLTIQLTRQPPPQIQSTPSFHSALLSLILRIPVLPPIHPPTLITLFSSPFLL